MTPAETRHVEALTALLEEKDRYYGVTEFEPLERRVAKVTEALFGEVAAGFIVLAWDGDRLAGLAAYAFLWPAAGVTRSLFLKELYIAESHRRTGVGRLLMDELFTIATKHECSRVEWTADQPNEGALRFYESLGVPVKHDKLFYRVKLDGTT